MAVLDGDGDGRLSRVEAGLVAHPELRFEDWDRDGDDMLDAAELRLLLYGVSPLLERHRGGDEADQAGRAAREAAEGDRTAPASW